MMRLPLATLTQAIRNRDQPYLMVVWLVVAVIALATFALTIPNRAQAIIAAHHAATVATTLLPPATIANYIFLLDLLILLVYTVVGVVLYLGLPDHRAATVMSIALITISVIIVRPLPLLPTITPLAALLENTTFYLAMVAMFAFCLIFPTGRSVLPFGQFLLAGWALFILVAIAGPNLIDYARTTHWPPRYQIHPLVLLLVAATLVAIVAHRYRHTPDSIGRDQIRWVVAGLATVAFGLLLFDLYSYLSPTSAIPWGAQPIPVALSYLLTAAFPLSIAIALLRPRRYHFSEFFNEALIYTILTASLTIIFSVVVILLQGLFATLIGQNTALAAIIATLFVAGLANPLRQRLRRVISHRFQRNQLDFRESFLAFSQELRTVFDYAHLLNLLVTRATDLMRTDYAVLYLYSPDPPPHKTLAHRAPDSLPQQLFPSATVVRTLRAGQAAIDTNLPFSILIPLLAPASHAITDTLIGILALGPRQHRHDYTRDELDLLRIFATRAGVALSIARILESRQAETRRKDVAEAASRAKSSFLASMSHELRTPLNAIIGYSEMLIEELTDAHQSEFIPDLEQIRNAGRYQLELVNNILDLSKIESSQIEVFAESFDIAAVLRDISYTLHPIAARTGNSLTLDLPPTLGLMTSDVMKVRQMLFNLASNALKFTERGHVAIDSRRQSTPSGDRIVFQVSDTGIGIPPENLDRLFLPFEQVTSDRRYGGTGLGLTITRHYADLLGGEVKVASTPGVGSTFTLTLPATLDLTALPPSITAHTATQSHHPTHPEATP